MGVIEWIAAVAGLAIAVFAGVLVLPAVSKTLSKKERLLRNVKWALLLAYILVILYQTLLFRTTSYHATYRLSLFWSYRKAFAVGTDSPFFGISITSGSLLVQIILNILLYIPFGYLLPFAMPGLSKPGRFPSRARVAHAFRTFPWRAVLIGAALSAATEFAQLFFRLGLFEFDDIFNNTLGCFLGVVLFQLFAKPRLSKIEKGYGGKDG